MARPPVDRISIPVVGMTDNDFERLSTAFGDLSIFWDDTVANITDAGEITAWRAWTTSPAVWITSVALSTSAAVCFGISMVKFIQYVRHVGFKSLPSVCLLFNMFALFDIFVVWGLDPVGQRQLLTALTNESMRIAPIPFLGSTMLLLIFFWWETLRPTRLHFTFNIDRFRLPASIVIFSFFCVTALSIINRSIGIRSSGTSWIFKVVLSLCTLPILLFFLITSIRIIRKILATQKQTAKQPMSSAITDATHTDTDDHHQSSWNDEALELEQQQALRRVFQVAVKLSGIAACLTTTVISGLMMLAPDFNAWQPVWTYFMWYLMHASIVALAFFCILIFKSIN